MILKLFRVATSMNCFDGMELSDIQKFEDLQLIMVYFSKYELLR